MAGSKPGERRGGRKKGTPNANRAHLVEVSKRAASEGITPLEVMIEAMRRRIDADDWAGAATHAKDAAPYVHPRLSNIDANVKGNLTVIAKTGVPRVGRD